MTYVYTYDHFGTVLLSSNTAALTYYFCNEKISYSRLQCSDNFNDVCTSQTHAKTCHDIPMICFGGNVKVKLNNKMIDFPSLIIAQLSRQVLALSRFNNAKDIETYVSVKLFLALYGELLYCFLAGSLVRSYIQSILIYVVNMCQS